MQHVLIVRQASFHVRVSLIRKLCKVISAHLIFESDGRKIRSRPTSYSVERPQTHPGTIREAMHRALGDAVFCQEHVGLT